MFSRIFSASVLTLGVASKAALTSMPTYATTDDGAVGWDFSAACGKQVLVDGTVPESKPADWVWGNACSKNNDQACGNSCTDCRFAWPKDAPAQWNDSRAKCMCNNYAITTWTFDLCEPVKGSTEEVSLLAISERTTKSGSTTTTVYSQATDKYTPVYNRELVTKEDGTTQSDGLLISNNGGSVCNAATGEKYSWSTVLTCDADTEGAVLQSTKPQINGCTAQVTYKGTAGCPQYDLVDELNWLAENQWFVGLIYLAVSPFIAFFGLKMFPYVAATISSLFAMFFVCLLSASFDTFESPAGFWITMALALVAGIATGCFVRRKIWITVGLLGAIGGFFGGILILNMISSMSDWTSAWGLWVFGFTFGLLGFFAACKLGAPVVNMCTSFIGSYLFVRAITLLFSLDQWPTESEIMSGQLDTNQSWVFWLLVAVLGMLTVIAVKVQATMKQHAELDAYSKQ